MGLILNSLNVAIGGAIGSVLRFWLVETAVRALGGGFPWGTIVVNVTGSFAIGFLATLTSENDLSSEATAWRHFMLTGILGGYTTFSAFSLQSLRLMQEGRWEAAVANILGSMALCLLAAWLGHVAVTPWQR